MTTNSIKRWEYLCEIIPGLILTIPEQDFSHKPSPAKWSKKEVVGHLVDSATNNHQRFSRAQFENSPVISYDTDKWNASGHYMAYESRSLILFWESYNKHLITLVKNIPCEKLQNLCRTSEEGTAFTLGFLIEDYVVHLEHHLKQIVEYT